jgi:hypothetical protein
MILGCFIPVLFIRESWKMCQVTQVSVCGQFSINNGILDGESRNPGNQKSIIEIVAKIPE